MFYIAEALLLGRGLAYSKHSGVHAAFGEHFVKTGVVPPEFHRYLIRGMEVRHAGDYGRGRTTVTPEEASGQIAHAEEFLALAERLIGALPHSDQGHGWGKILSSKEYPSASKESSMARYWVLCMSEDNYEIAKQHGLIGMSERAGKAIHHVGIGDMITFYINRKKVDSASNDSAARV
jgi:hypothetical protein